MKTLVSILAAAVIAIFAANPARGAVPVRIGVLPVLDTLPLHVALEDGLFAKAGLDVTLVPFQSALERDTAMQAGRLDGYFGDPLSALLLMAHGAPMKIVTVSYRPMPSQRMFALMAAPGAKAASIADMKRGRVGLSSATVIEYVLDLMLARAGNDAGKGWTRIEIKRIPLRLQMLLSEQIEMALLPEPLATLAERGACRALATDEGLDVPLTVISLSERLLGKEREAFLSALAGAVSRLSERPDDYRALMARTCAIPEPILAVFRVPVYPPPALPSPEALGAVQKWMVARGLLKEPLPLDRAVAGR